jgi:hypothetical protein
MRNSRTKASSWMKSRNPRLLFRLGAPTARALAWMVICAILFPVQTGLASALGEEARDASESVLSSAGRFARQLSLQTKQQRTQKKTVHPQDNGAVQFYLCPNTLTMYVGEPAVLVPIPYDGGDNILNSAPISWTTANPAVATVTSVGEVDALAPGQTTVTAQAGDALANVTVFVNSGARPILNDDQWAGQYGGACGNPYQSRSDSSPGAPGVAQSAGTDQRVPSAAPAQRFRDAAVGNAGATSVTTQRAAYQPSDLGGKPAMTAPSAAAGGLGSGLVGTGPLLGGTQTENAPFSQALVNSVLNAIGSPRLRARTKAKGSASKINHILASSDYEFTAPIISMPGRGQGLNLNLIYNSQVWAQDPNTQFMSYDVNKGLHPDGPLVTAE